MPCLRFTAARHNSKQGQQANSSIRRATEQHTNLVARLVSSPTAPPSDSMQNRDDQVNDWGNQDTKPKYHQQYNLIKIITTERVFNNLT